MRGMGAPPIGEETEGGYEMTRLDLHRFNSASGRRSWFSYVLARVRERWRPLLWRVVKISGSEKLNRVLFLLVMRIENITHVNR
jgi:hypothetical protein